MAAPRGSGRHSAMRAGGAGRPRPGTAPVALFITYEYPCLSPRTAPLFWLAREAGFRSFVVPWCRLDVGDRGACARGGFEALADGGKRPLAARERIDPCLIVHRVRMDDVQERLFRRLAEGHPDAWLSYDPELRFVGSKWGAELCLRAGAERGVEVRRPETFLVEKREMGASLRALGACHSLIFKPADGSQGRGIFMSSPESFDRVVQDVVDASPRRFVVQRIVEDAIALDGRRFDLRLYALVTSFRPLRFRVFRDGLARVAAKPSAANRAPDPLATLTNCAYRRQSGAAVDNLTIGQLLTGLREQGYAVADFWPEMDALAESLFSCFASWPPLEAAVHRLFLLTGLDIMLVPSGGGIKPLFIESNHTPLLFNFGPKVVDEALVTMARGCVRALFEACRVRPLRRPPSPPLARDPRTSTRASRAAELALGEGGREAPCPGRQGQAAASEPGTRLAGKTADALRLPDEQPHVETEVSGIVDALSGAGSPRATRAGLPGFAAAWGDVRPRERLLEALARSWPAGKRVRIGAARSGLQGVEIRLGKRDGVVVVDGTLGKDGDPAALPHPLAAVLPRIGRAGGTVDTELRPDARFEYLHPGLVGPSFGEPSADREAALLRYLGRVIADRSDGDPFGPRYVEPGVGRSVLVDWLRIDGQPHLHDFGALGVGLTPYSEAGFFLRGPDIDGLCSLKKAWHRQRIGATLEAAGCRVPVTAAIIAVPGLSKRWPDGTKEPAAILVRGFRMSLRVQQLDPFHGLLLSDRYRPLVAAFLLEGAGPATDEPASREAADPAGDAARGLDPGLARELEWLSCRPNCLRHVVYGTDAEPAATPSGERRARAMRRAAIHRYAPILLRIAERRLAWELGRDPEQEPLGHAEYVVWFAERMGEQLGAMRNRRFLFDYRMARDDWTRNALRESQVSLLAELIDLDTGIFVDSTDREGILLTGDQIKALQTGFEGFHLRDVAEGRNIVRTVALIAGRGDARAAGEAVDRFRQAYEAHGGAPRMPADDPGDADACGPAQRRCRWSR